MPLLTWSGYFALFTVDVLFCQSQNLLPPQITAISQATQAAAAVMKPRLPVAPLPQGQVKVIIAYQEGLDQVWFQEETAEAQSLQMQEELQKM